MPHLSCIVNTECGRFVIRVKLREAMESHRRRTGERMTYERSGADYGAVTPDSGIPGLATGLQQHTRHDRQAMPRA